MGVQIDVQKLKKMTNLEFIKDVEEWSPTRAERQDDQWTPEKESE